MKSPLLLLLTIVIAGSELSGQSFAEIRQDDLRIRMQNDGQLVGPDQEPWMEYKDNGQFIRLSTFSHFVMIGLEGEGSFYSSHGSLSRPLEQIRKPAYPKVWQVTAQEVADHIADFEDNGVVDNPIPAVFAWPGRGNPSFADYNEGLTLPDDGGFTAEFWDVDGNGIYNPADGDYPVLGVRGCSQPIVPTQLSWAAYKLRGMESDTLVFEGSVSLFTIGCQEENALNDAVFTVHRVKNRSTTTFQDMYWGAFTDPDIGCPDNDYVGSFPARLASFAYNATPEDFPCPLVTEEMTFGDHPVTWGMDTYRGPVISSSGAPVPFSTITYYNKQQEGVPQATTGPMTIPETYNYLQGKWRDGTPLTVGGLGYGGEEATHFAFPGFPEQEGNWTEWEAGNIAGDRYLVQSYGPFSYSPGAVNELITAYTVFDGEGDHLEKVTGLRDQIDELQAYFDACFEVDGFGMPPCTQVLTDTEDVPGQASVPVRIFPNPAHDLLHIEVGGEPFQFQLLDQFGHLVRQGQTTPLSVQDLPAGLYYLRLHFNGQWVSRKVVLQP